MSITPLQYLNNPEPSLIENATITEADMEVEPYTGLYDFSVRPVDDQILILIYKELKKMLSTVTVRDSVQNKNCNAAVLKAASGFCNSAQVYGLIQGQTITINSFNVRVQDIFV